MPYPTAEQRPLENTATEWSPPAEIVDDVLRSAFMTAPTRLFIANVSRPVVLRNVEETGCEPDWRNASFSVSDGSTASVSPVSPRCALGEGNPSYVLCGIGCCGRCSFSSCGVCGACPGISLLGGTSWIVRASSERVKSSAGDDGAVFSGFTCVEIGAGGIVWRIDVCGNFWIFILPDGENLSAGVSPP